MATRTFLLASSLALLNQLDAKAVGAQEGTSASHETPAPSTTPVVTEPSTSSTTVPAAKSDATAPSTPAPTAEPSETGTKVTPQQLKWRPLVLRSEIPPDQRPIFGSFKGTYLMAGANLGLGLTQASPILGGEVSLVRQTSEFVWTGAYVDGVRDFGRDETRFSTGAEVGWSAFGLDGGYLLIISPNGVYHGLTMRPLVSMGYVTAFGRFSKDLTTPSDIWCELGLLLKYPIQL